MIDSFWISILTAILLKLLLDALKGVEHAVAGYFRAREGAVYKVLGIYERLGDGAAATVEGATPSP